MMHDEKYTVIETFECVRLGLGFFFKENCDISPTFLSFNYYYYFCKLTSVSYYIVPSLCYRALNQFRMKSRFAHGPVTSVPHSCNVRLVILQMNRSPVRFPRTCSTRRQIREPCFSDDLGPLFLFLGRPRAKSIFNKKCINIVQT